jgi:hypothetical protein
MKKVLIVIVLITITVNNSSFAQLQNHIVACYPFNGNANDESGNGHDGLPFGAVLTTDRFGNPNSAYEFNGMNHFIGISQLGSITQSNEFSLSAWVQANQVKSQVIVMMDPDDSSNRLLAAVHFSHNGIPFSFWDFGDILGSGRLAVGNTTFSNQWEHYVFTTGVNGMFMYKDGVLVNGTMSSDMLIDRTRIVQIGGGEDVNNVPFYFDGKLDDIVFFDKQLDLAEVNLLYQFGGLCSTVGLEEYGDHHIEVYPSIASDHINIQIGDQVTLPVAYNIADISGKLHRPETTLHTSGNEKQVDVSELPAGMYLIRLRSGNEVNYRRFVKN